MLFFLAVAASIETFSYTQGFVYAAVGLTLILAFCPLLAVAAEIGTALLVAVLVVPNGPVAVFPAVAITLMVLAGRTPSKLARLLVLPLLIGWYVAVVGVHHSYTVLQLLVVGTVFASVVVFTIDTLLFRPLTIRKLDLILSSASGNTAHYANAFIEGARSAGSEVVVHRFHDYRAFRADLTGDALAVVFPVIGWKPPWPFLFYLLSNLPKGHGKPAIVLMTCVGGPENTAFIAKLALILRGYRPVGQSWAIYPLNVVTLRIGSSKMWRRLDRLVPLLRDSKEATRSGADFVSKIPTTQPMILWPTPMSIVGLLLDNPWLNVLLYRTYVWKRRCIKCGICIHYCPARRLIMKNGYPKSCGTCTLCFGCINICPTHAMQMWFFTEYGNAYAPRWPELVAKSKPEELNQ